jgi:glycerol kinase
MLQNACFLSIPLAIFDMQISSQAMDVITIFDIGRTNKKFILYDAGLNIVHREERVFTEKTDDDGFACDDISEIASWMRSCINTVVKDRDCTVRALNFTSYGASLVYLDEHGKRLTPVYNYLKPLPEKVVEGFYESWGGVEEFSRRTASPALGMLNSGLQILWLKKNKPDTYRKLRTVLHLPQYLSFLFTGRAVSDYTSIGCHTALWDFDNGQYHPWVKGEKISLPEPVVNSTLFDVEVEGRIIKTGIGIHDSSASLVPYFKSTLEQFILISTGTWCIFMNPFNTEPLTAGQLRKDTLCYISVNGKQVKSSRFFLGHIHDMNVARLDDYFGVTDGHYKTIRIKSKKIDRLLAGNRGRVFFRHGIPHEYVDNEVDLSQFLTYADAYHQMMCDLVNVSLESYRLIIPGDDKTEVIYITGGFAMNDTFVRLMAAKLPDKRIFTSDIENASALGAAMVIYENAMGRELPPIYLGLRAIINNQT